MDTFFLGLLVQLCCGEGGTLKTNITGVCGECSQCFGHTGFVPAHGVCAFPVYPVQALGCSARNCLRQALGCVHFPGLSHSGSGSRVLHKGTVGWACVLCPSQVRAAQVTRCLASALFPHGLYVLSPPRSQQLGFLGAQWVRRLMCAMCLFWGADLWLQPS